VNEQHPPEFVFFLHYRKVSVCSLTARQSWLIVHILETPTHLKQRTQQDHYHHHYQRRRQIMRLVEHDPHLRALAASEARALASGPLVGNINRSISRVEVSAGAQPPSATTPRAAASRLMAAVAERLSGQGGGREGGTGGTSGMGRYSGTSNGGALEK